MIPPASSQTKPEMEGRSRGGSVLGGASIRERARRCFIVLPLILLCGAADGSWLTHVPDADRNMRNLYAGRADAIAGGAKLFSDHCASCHGKDGLGHGKKPSLRSERVQHATDGEVFWLLKNGNLARGMPTWSKLPEESRWQVVTYVKNLGVKSTAATSSKRADRAPTGE
jgi:mono/diheme cytochrome c family protein